MLAHPIERHPGCAKGVCFITVQHKSQARSVLSALLCTTAVVVPQTVPEIFAGSAKNFKKVLFDELACLTGAIFASKMFYKGAEIST